MNTFKVFILVVNFLVLILSLFTPFSILFIPYQKRLDVLAYVPDGPILGDLKAKSMDDPYYAAYRDSMDSLQVIPLKQVGPESMSFNSKGQLYFSMFNGDIRYVDPPFKMITKEEYMAKNSTVVNESTYVTTVGRALGITHDRHDNLVIADPVKGLLHYDVKSGDLRILAASYNKSKILHVNDVKIDPNTDVIYFTDSSALPPVYDKYNGWNTLLPCIYACYAQTPTGSLYSYNPKTKGLKRLITGIRYANGIAIDARGENIYVSETCASRVIKYNLKNDESEVFIKNIPGYNDGLDMIDNELYVSIYGGRKAMLDFVGQYPLLKAIAFHIPFFKVPIHYPSLAVFDELGNVVRYYQTEITPLKSIASSIELPSQRNTLLLGNLLNDFIGVMKMEK